MKYIGDLYKVSIGNSGRLRAMRHRWTNINMCLKKSGMREWSGLNWLSI
jgi:hypothetical protein